MEIKKTKLSDSVKHAGVSMFCIASIFLAHPALAKVDREIMIDMYRSNQITLDTIKNDKILMKKLHGIADIFRKPVEMATPDTQQKLIALMMDANSELSKLGDFSLVSISPIIYPGNSITYFTADLVDKKDENRLKGFTKNPDKNIDDPDHLIQTWQEYEKTGFELAYKDKDAIKFKTCPAHHCIFGFEHPLLSKYLKIFNTTVPKDKSQLIQILKYDKDPQKRTSVPYLLAHIKNGEELVKILTPAMHDGSSGVRNSAMRVIAETLSGTKNLDFPIQDAVNALDYPLVTDRNKALYIIQSLSDQPRYAKYIIKHAGPQLMDELKLSQQNVHSLSYNILMKISGKKFNERDYQAWEQWLKKNS